MKLRDRVVVGFCLSLVLVTVLFVVDLQNENARRQAVADNDATSQFHGRSDRSQDAIEAQSAWNVIVSTLIPSSQPAQPTRPGAPQPYPHSANEHPKPAVPDLYAMDTFADLTERLFRSSESRWHRGNIPDWTVVRDVIVDDTNDEGFTSNEYLEDNLQ